MHISHRNFFEFNRLKTEIQTVLLLLVEEGKCFHLDIFINKRTSVASAPGNERLTVAYGE